MSNTYSNGNGYIEGVWKRPMESYSWMISGIIGMVFMGYLYYFLLKLEKDYSDEITLPFAVKMIFVLILVFMGVIVINELLKLVNKPTVIVKGDIIIYEKGGLLSSKNEFHISSVDKIVVFRGYNIVLTPGANVFRLKYDNSKFPAMRLGQFSNGSDICNYIVEKNNMKCEESNGVVVYYV